MIQHLTEIVEEARKRGKKRLAVAYGQDSHTLEAVYEAYKEGLVEPTLYGEKSVIEQDCAENDIALLPGVLTPTDVATSLQFGYKTMKLFPAGSMPRHYVKDLQGPFDGTNYMAIGGVSPANIREFFDAGCISVGLASSLMPKDAVAANDWEACAAYVRGMVDQIRR